MDVLVAVGSALVGAAAGWFFPGFQHHLYSEAEFRSDPATGKKLLSLRLLCAVATGAGVGLALRPDHYDMLPALVTGGFLLVLVAVSSTDLDRRRIPNVLTYPAAIAALALCWVWPDRSIFYIAVGAGLAIAVAAMLMFLRFGVGDSKLVVLIGLLVGWPGIMPALLYGILGGGFVAFVLLFTRGRGTKFAYGPYLAAGAAAIMLFPQLA